MYIYTVCTHVFIRKCCIRCKEGGYTALIEPTGTFSSQRTRAAETSGLLYNKSPTKIRLFRQKSPTKKRPLLLRDFLNFR